MVIVPRVSRGLMQKYIPGDILRNFSFMLENAVIMGQNCHCLEAIFECIDIHVTNITLSHGKKVKHNNRSPEGGRYMSSPTTTLPNTKPSDVILQHTNRQIHGYLSEQADMIENSLTMECMDKGENWLESYWDIF